MLSPRKKALAIRAAMGSLLKISKDGAFHPPSPPRLIRRKLETARTGPGRQDRRVEPALQG